MWEAKNWLPRDIHLTSPEPGVRDILNCVGGRWCSDSILSGEAEGDLRQRRACVATKAGTETWPPARGCLEPRRPKRQEGVPPRPSGGRTACLQLGFGRLASRT